MIREAGLLKRLNHENIIELRDVFLSQGRIFMVSELCDCNLRQYMEELLQGAANSIELQRVRSFTKQILSALAFCHDRRIIHRDLKPDNILLDAPRHTLKIADFGMARTFTRGNAYTDHCVTSWYRPPEIILGDRCYGPPVDLWSMGCVLAEMLALAAPFCCSTEVECLLQIFRLRGTPDEDTWPGVSTLPHYNASFPRWRPQPAAALLHGGGGGATDADALDLLERMLQLRPADRIQARAALDDHPFCRPAPLTAAATAGPVALAAPGDEPVRAPTNLSSSMNDSAA